MKYLLTIERFLWNIIESGMYQKADWQNWADRMILENDDVDNWIYDLSLATTKEEVVNTLFVSHDGYGAYYLPTEFCDYEVFEGYYYLLYKEGKMDLKDFLWKSAELEDAHACDHSFYGMANRDISEISDIINNHFKPYANEALRQKQIIETITYKEIPKIRNEV